MVNLIFCAIALFIVQGIPYLIDSKNRKEQESKNADEFMRKSFGEDYKEKMVGWSKGE